MKLSTKQGIYLGIGLLWFTIMGASLYVGTTVEAPETTITAEMIIAADEAGDDQKLTKIGQVIGLDLEEMKKLAIQIKEEMAYHEAMKAREATLGTWKEAMENGVRTASSFDSETNEQKAYYDTTGDGMPDFEITLVDQEPVYWRYMNDKGEAYG